ncbi:hypothetical protein CGLO_17168 [Colletotrichum gloeosporioides Cg-14]|uniref:Uncharacterized protein n=1 Tax=Colletotrichum gloeosporioides (strain Cg-14) TaxID=1237896 RepID=T0JU88_COLGC|nr:hypothetical protein CGLO_17168 [Colletotrichum gloeosporioides Cg-14]
MQYAPSIADTQYTDVSLPPSPPLRMSKSTLFEVLHRIGHAFSHVQYAVCGTAAMVAFDFDRRKPTHVSIVCPSHTRDVLASWAVTGGMMLYPSKPNEIGIPVDGDTWMIQVKYLETDDNHRFERLDACHFNFGCDDVTTAVLTPAAQLEQIAQVYIDPRYNQSWRYKERLGSDAIWLLEQMCKQDVDKFGMDLRHANIPTIRDQRFWLVFTTAHPEAVGLFYDAGLRDEEEEVSGNGRENGKEYEQEQEHANAEEYDAQEYGQEYGPEYYQEIDQENEEEHDQEQGHEQERARVESPVSPHDPPPEQPRRRDESGRSRRRSSRVRSRSRTRTDQGSRRRRRPSEHGPILTRAEERRVAMDRARARGQVRRRSSQEPNKFSLSSALDSLLGGGHRDGYRR